MRVHHEDERVTIWHGDALDVLRQLPDASVDAVCTDPPYGISFMGKEWDAPGKATRATTTAADKAANPYGRARAEIAAYTGDAATASRAFGDWCLEWATECLRVLKPGGHLLAFGGTRTWHRLACAVEDAGFEVRDSIAWLYGSGFPKSLDVSKAIDKAAGAERKVVGRYVPPSGKAWNLERDESVPGYSGGLGRRSESMNITAPATPEAAQWAGWGTALKPAFEPIVVARKPLAGTVAQNVLAHGTGALNIDACRIPGEVPSVPQPVYGVKADGVTNFGSGVGRNGQMSSAPGGRWPTNVVLDDSQAAELDRQSGERTSGILAAHHTRNPKESGILGAYGSAEGERGYGDSGGASRFFPTFRYEAKAPTSERPRYKREGGSDNATTYGQMKTRECNVCGSRANPAGGKHSGKPWPSCGHDDWSWVEQQSARDEYVAHPTVKPLDLMRWLVRLVTPPGGTVLEPFAGSGTTVEACIVEGFRCIAIEREADYLPLIMQRVNRRTDPVAYIQQAGEDLGLFDLEGEGA